MTASSEFNIQRSRWVAWFQLVRLPNLLTVPGDPLVGFWLAEGRAFVELIPIIIASLLFYAGGLITNDIADLETDLRERPTRPLPSGRIKKNHALMAAAVLFVVAECLCWSVSARTGWLGHLLLFSILFYNFFTKKNKFAGPLNMGLCRGLNVLLGASLVDFTVHAQSAAVVFTWFIICVTWIARNEAIQKRKPETVGLLISMLIPMQASFIGLSGHATVACLWLALWPLHRVCSKSFYAS